MARSNNVSTLLMNGKTRVGVIGLGFGLHHIRGYQDCGNAEVVGVCSRTRAKAENVASSYGIPSVFTDYHDMLKVGDLDVVSIATPVYLHHTMTLEALDEGKHVLCEKPLAMNTKEAMEMLEKAEETGLKHMTNFCWRFTPKLFNLKHLVDTNYVGALYHVEAKWMEGYGADPTLLFNWRHRKAEGGIGVLGDMGVHIIDMIRWIAGDFRRVCAHTATIVKERPDSKSREAVATELEDSCMFMGELERQVQVLFHVSRVALFGNYISLEIYGEKGTLVYRMHPTSDDIPMSLQKTSLLGASGGDRKLEEIPTPSKLEKIPSTYELFIEGVRHDKKVNPSFQEGLKVQEITDALVLSAKQERWVQIS